ncbi:hypothetical protein FHX45_002076 [Amycolatopsis granulosa]|nr:hypothetical protein [Amycolatopsis granulosa]
MNGSARLKLPGEAPGTTSDEGDSFKWLVRYANGKLRMEWAPTPLTTETYTGVETI